MIVEAPSRSFQVGRFFRIIDFVYPCDQRILEKRMPGNGKIHYKNLDQIVKRKRNILNFQS